EVVGAAAKRPVTQAPERVVGADPGVDIGHKAPVHVIDRLVADLERLHVAAARLEREELLAVGIGHELDAAAVFEDISVKGMRIGAIVRGHCSAFYRPDCRSWVFPVFFLFDMLAARMVHDPGEFAMSSELPPANAAGFLSPARQRWSNFDAR